MSVPTPSVRASANSVLGPDKRDPPAAFLAEFIEEQYERRTRSTRLKRLTRI